MLALAQKGLSTQQVDDALHGVSGRRTVTFKYDLYDSAGNLKKTLANCSAGAVTYDVDQAVKRTLSFTVREDATTSAPAVNWLTDRVQPTVMVLVPNTGGITADFPLGRYWITSPGRAINAGGQVVRTVQGYDPGQVLQDDRLATRLVIAAGQLYTTQIGSILAGAGISNPNIAASTVRTPVSREWAPNTPKATVIDDLLAAINYYRLWFDATGVAQVQPFVLPTQRTPVYTLATDARSVIGMGALDTVDYFAVPNRWVVTISQPDRPTAAATVYQYDNTNPQSPTNQAARGRVILGQIQATDAADGTTASAQAQRLAFFASQIFETVDLPLGLLPMFADHDVVTLVHNRLGITGSGGAGVGFELRGWQMPLVAGQGMTLKLRAINPV